jgi:segregation and condensation protein B
MSLKAKLEAVIYAAEEPVTLAQLAALFAADALEWKSAQEAALAESAGQTAPEGEPQVNAEFDYQSLEPVEDERAPAEPVAADAGEAAVELPESAVGQVDPTAAEPDAEGEPEPVAEDAAETPAETPVVDAEAPIDPEVEEKRLAKARDREVRNILRGLLDELIATYESDDRGIEIKEIAGGYRMATKPECHDAARMFVKSLKPALKLSLPALETLAVIAYKQPVTAPEVNEIRGVDSSGVFGSLLARKLIATAGRKQVIGRPILYKTTKEFLLKFGLKDVSELPSMEEFEKIAQLEFEEMEPPASEGESAPEVNEDLSLEQDENSLGQDENSPEQDDKSEAPASESAESVPQTEEGKEEQTEETAATADSNPAPVEQELEINETIAERAAIQAEPTPAEAAPAAPSPPEQAETETVPHD